MSEEGSNENGSDEGIDLLVTKWAPFVRLHPNEQYFPMEPMDFIKASRFRQHVKLGSDKGYNKTTKKWVTGNSHASAYYDVPISVIDSFGPDKNGKNRRPRDPNAGSSRKVFLDPKGSVRGKKSPTGQVSVFSSVRQEPQWQGSGPATFIQYWWFLGYNNGYFKHHGDWEHCTTVIQGGAFAGAYLAAHRDTTLYKPPDLEWKQGRFIVYMANGSHASYPKVGTFLPYADSTKKGGVEWETWQLLGFVEDQPWKNFAGAWGEVGEFEFTTGPLGPWHKSGKE